MNIKKKGERMNALILELEYPECMIMKVVEEMKEHR